ncbi:MAG: sodium-dependent bicarbonate transport family permease [Aquabacterium sp.]|uniref:sodium-dependent bicarbonate transport family permease n=1 Tax=Aquabacterium sp. TaxID=1872578 RepID=UPI0025B98E16|nr:sodium-dependent bicarbonate transport family permease [Aquabacterium sp.]MBI5926249.1 sodium-dependent bicarbonate transport family permease [Aquabacterium sp.]
MHNLLDPAILFFVFGVVAGALKSNLEIPPAISKFLSLYLLMALGLKGGFALAHTGLNAEVAIALLAAMLMAFLVPVIGYQLLKKLVRPFDAVAISACYGSVSAVTFVTAMQYLETQQLSPGGHMTVALVLMESPAIIVSVVLANNVRQATGAPGTGTSMGKILHESFTDGALLLLMGSMVIGYLSGDTGKAMMAPFSIDLFKGMLAFFLLNMGLLVARNIGSIKDKSPLLMAYAVLGPLCHAAIALGVSALLQLPVADAALLMVLSASASYIVVPAALRYAIPEANPSLYFGLSLGVTFPLNILFGIPLYTEIARQVQA